jgi:hypothetical protein
MLTDGGAPWIEAGNARSPCGPLVFTQRQKYFSPNCEPFQVVTR